MNLKPLPCLFSTVNLTPAERVAQRTWSTLGRAKQLRARFGEETLTDLLVLDMLPHQRTRGFWLRSTTRLDESRWGADLLVAVRHQTGRWSRLAIQAKKLYSDHDRYLMLNRVKESRFQLDKLERFAWQHYALPLYLLYNHSQTAERSKHWHCQQPFAKRQLGCTLVPSWHIRRVLDRPPRDFHSVHNVSQCRPWRCAFDCPSAEKELFQMAFRTRHRDTDKWAAENAEYDWPFAPMDAAWPGWLFRTSRKQMTRQDVDQIRSELSEFYRSVAEDAPRDSFRSDERWLYPARLLMVDRSEEPSVRSRGGEPPP